MCIFLLNRRPEASCILLQRLMNHTPPVHWTDKVEHSDVFESLSPLVFGCVSRQAKLKTSKLMKISLRDMLQKHKQIVMSGCRRGQNRL